MVSFTRVSILAGIVSMFALSAPIWADPLPALLSLVPLSGAVNVGGTISYDINVSNASELIGFQFDLSFDPTVVSAVSIEEGAFFPSVALTTFVAGTIDNVGGSIVNTLDVLNSSAASGDGTLAVLKLMGVGAGTSSIDISNVILLNSDLSLTTPSCMSCGSVDVKSNAVPEPSSLSLLLAAVSALFLLTVAKRVS